VRCVARTAGSSALAVIPSQGLFAGTKPSDENLGQKVGIELLKD
jgi:hypothetical protein